MYRIKAIRLSLFVFLLMFSAIILEASEVTFSSGEDKKDSLALSEEVWEFRLEGENEWDSINISLPFGEANLPDLNGIIWFRWKVKVPERFRNEVVAFSVSHPGASEIYLDGELIKTFGQPSSDPDKEETYDPNRIPIPVFFNDDKRHVIKIKYSNLKATESKDKLGVDQAGISLKISKFNPALQEYLLTLQTRVTITTLLGGIFLTLGLIHLIIFFFYRVKKNNLFFAIFMLSCAAICFLPEIAASSHDAVLSMKVNRLMIYLIPIFLMAFLSFQYSLFYKKMPLIFWIMLGVTALIILLQIFGMTDLRVVIALCFAFAVFIESFRVVLRAIIKKKPGSWIVGSGVIFLLLTILGVIIAAIASGGTLLVDGSTISEILILIVVILAVLSLPISMSVYLAWDISKTNRELSLHLKEVQRLSKETIRQEQEKKQILEQQKGMLEQQVLDRTKEIRTQKDIVDEKNKEILDSITYAKRIQSAILPPNRIVKEYLKNSFILYKPKDIVAGDFYWMEKAPSNLPDGEDLGGAGGAPIFFAAADCTGHGVPGAMVSVVCHNALNRSVREYDLQDPGKILDKTREIVISEFEKSEEEVKDGMDIALCSLHTQTQTLHYSGAHNPLWIIRKDSMEVEEIKGNKQPIGKFSKPVPFATHQITLNKGDAIYLFSDGFSDQFGGKKGKKYKSKNMKKFLLSIRDKEMEEQKSLLNQEFEKWKGDLEQLDDVCVVGIRF